MATSEVKDDTKMVVMGVQDVPTIEKMHTIEEGKTIEIDNAYLSSPWFPKFFRGVLCQMILFGA